MSTGRHISEFNLSTVFVTRTVLCFCLFFCHSFECRIEKNKSRSKKTLEILVIYINYVFLLFCLQLPTWHWDGEWQKKKWNDGRAGSIRKCCQIYSTFLLDNFHIFSICIFFIFLVLLLLFSPSFKHDVKIHCHPQNRPQEIFRAFYFILPQPSLRCLLKFTQIRNLFLRKAEQKKIYS